MNKERGWSVSVRSVEREEICFAPNTGWQVRTQGVRLHFNTDWLMELRAQDQILITAGEWGTASWAAFIGTVVDCGPDSILLYSNPQYESRLMDIRRIERKFSPLNSIQGAQGIIDRFGVFPPFHYDEITKVDYEVEPRRDMPNNLSVTIKHAATGGRAESIDFYFEDIRHEVVSPAEESNICLQLSFSYEGEWIRVELEAVTGFSASFLCHTIVVQIQERC